MSNSNSPLGFFERYLSLWVGLCIVAGVGLGSFLPSLFQTIAQCEVASVIKQNYVHRRLAVQVVAVNSGTGIFITF